MEKLINGLKKWMAVLVLPCAAILAAFFPGTVRADDPLAMPWDRDERRTGDPLDTNDVGDNDSNDDDFQQDFGTSSSGKFVDLMIRSTNVLFVPQYNGSILTFRFIILFENGDEVEIRHAE